MIGGFPGGNSSGNVLLGPIVCFCKYDLAVSSELWIYGDFHLSIATFPRSVYDSNMKCRSVEPKKEIGVCNIEVIQPIV